MVGWARLPEIRLEQVADPRQSRGKRWKQLATLLRTVAVMLLRRIGYNLLALFTVPGRLPLVTSWWSQYIQLMVEHTFDAPRTCPACETEFSSAELKRDYHPVIVVSCPECGKLLWRPGFDDSSRLFVFDPNAEEGI